MGRLSYSTWGNRVSGIFMLFDKLCSRTSFALLLGLNFCSQNKACQEDFPGDASTCIFLLFGVDGR